MGARFAVVLLLAVLAPVVAETEDLVRAQYEKYPYPPYVPEQYRKVIPVERLGDLHITSQFVWGGARNFTARPLRVLVAGCGTGTAVLYYGIQFASLSPSSTIVCMDISQTALDIAKARRLALSRLFGMVEVEFIRGSILELPEMELGKFDLINSIGVLHHMQEYQRGLQTLSDALKPDGALVIMVYACHGRAPLYAMQGMMDLVLNVSGADRLSSETVQVAEDLKGAAIDLDTWPQLQEFALDKFQEKYNLGSTLTVDDFLHVQDTCFTINQLDDWVQNAGLRVSAFYNPSKYSPELFRHLGTGAEGDLQIGGPVLSPRIRKLVESMPMMERAALAERLMGTQIKHSFYAVKKSNPQQYAPHEIDVDAVPILKTYCRAAEAQDDLKSASEPLAFNYPLSNTICLEFPIPQLAEVLVEHFDGSMTLAEISELVAKQHNLGKDDVLKTLFSLVKTLQQMAKLAILRQKVHRPKGQLGYYERTPFRSCKWFGDFD